MTTTSRPGDLARRLREAADLAERAAVFGQYRELRTAPGPPVIIGGLDCAADHLRHAAAALADAPVADRRTMTLAVLQTAGSLVVLTAVLLLVPGPSSFLLLAAGYAGASVAAQAVRMAADSVHLRRAAARPDPAGDVPGMIAELRARLAGITGELDPVGDDRHLEAGRRLDAAHVWIDDADAALSR